MDVNTLRNNLPQRTIKQQLVLVGYKRRSQTSSFNLSKANSFAQPRKSLINEKGFGLFYDVTWLSLKRHSEHILRHISPHHHCTVQGERRNKKSLGSKKLIFGSTPICIFSPASGLANFPWQCRTDMLAESTSLACWFSAGWKKMTSSRNSRAQKVIVRRKWFNEKKEKRQWQRAKQNHHPTNTWNIGEVEMAKGFRFDCCWKIGFSLAFPHF